LKTLWFGVIAVPIVIIVTVVGLLAADDGFASNTMAVTVTLTETLTTQAPQLTTTTTVHEFCTPSSQSSGEIPPTITSSTTITVGPKSPTSTITTTVTTTSTSYAQTITMTNCTYITPTVTQTVTSTMNP